MIKPKSLCGYLISQLQMKNQIDKIAVVENDFVENGLKPFLTGKQIHAIDKIIWIGMV
jgi:hypothetical protein